MSSSWAKKSLKRLFPQIGNVEFEAEWYGKIGMTNDSLPKFHRLARNVVGFSGYNGRGIVPGTVFGKILSQLVSGEITEDDLPRDVLTVLLRNEDKIEMPPDVLRREMAFYLQAGSHSTSNSLAHGIHEIFLWCAQQPERWQKVETDRLFLQRCVHESLRLHPASPVAWRRPTCPVSMRSGQARA